MKIVLITWGLGYIGSHAVVAFEKAGYKTVIVDNLSNSKLETLENIWKILGYKPDFYEVDLRDKENLRKIFKKYNFSWVIHFAWLKAVWESCEKPLEYFDNNINWSLKLFELMKEFNVKNIIFSSSATVYDLKMLKQLDWQAVNDINWDLLLKRWFKETDPTWNTTNPYGRSKFVLEEILQDLAKFSGFNVILLRYFNPIWAHPSWLIWEDPAWIPNNLLPYVMKVATGEYEKVKVFGNDYPTPDGTWVRDYIDVNDLVDGHLKAWEYLQKQAWDGFIDVFNLWTGKWRSVLEIIKAVEKVVGNKVPYEIVDRRPWDIAVSYCDPMKAGKILGFKTKITLEESIENMWRFYKQ